MKFEIHSRHHNPLTQALDIIISLITYMNNVLDISNKWMQQCPVFDQTDAYNALACEKYS